MKAYILGRGFIGKRMEVFLERAGWDVYIYDISMGMDLHGIMKNLKDRFDLIVNCAGLPGDGVSPFFNKIWLDALVYTWAMETKQPRILYFSDADVYDEKSQDSDRWTSGHYMKAWGSFPPMPGMAKPYMKLGEDFAIDAVPCSNMGWAKKTGELGAQGAIAAGVKVHVVRTFSVYGSDCPNTHIFSRIKEAASKASSPINDEVFWRDWVHVDDVALAALAVLQADEPGPVNICTGEATSAFDLYHKIAEILDPHDERLVDLEFKGKQSRAQIGDPEKLHKLFKPRSLTAGLPLALRWR